MGAVMMTEDIAPSTQPGAHPHTLTRGQLIASVVSYVLDRLSDPALLAHVKETGAWFGGQLQEIAQRTGRIRGIRGTGFMWGMDVMGTASHVVSEAMAAGLLVCTAGDYTVRLLPPLVAMQEELSEGLAVLESVL